MTAENRTQIEQLTTQIEEMWSHLATLFDDLNESDGWNQQHGADWTFADVPFHLAYCNRDLVSRGLRLGSEYPESGQKIMSSPKALGEWNEYKFSERPTDQSAQTSVDQWRDSCDDIRNQLAAMSDADLDRRCWFPIFLGWAKAADLLNFCLTHDWSEFTQLRVHMGRSEPNPSAAIARRYLGTILNFFPMMLNREAASGVAFSVVMAFTDPDVGAWTIQVIDGQAELTYGAKDDADLVMTQSTETFEKTFRGIQDPAQAMEAGDVQISNFQSLETFGQLFPLG